MPACREHPCLAQRSAPLLTLSCDPVARDQWNGIPSGRVGGNLKIIAARDIRRGEQVTIQYGAGMLSNDRMVAEYGFVDAAAAELDVQMLRRAARGPDAQSLVGPGAPLRATSVADDQALLKDASACLPGSRMATAVAFRLALKKALAAVGKL
mmetsp:Transcript_25789/g.86486  ORF Transcript_25789/g.86486 Transcript_25789/m.86486 type:complete len:153 (-) Transcript_25789:46-504(-)